jgi:polyhydroxybutyrate depolymerase
MVMSCLLASEAVLIVAAFGADATGANDYQRNLQVDGCSRSYLVHVPPKHDSKEPSPVVLVLHGAGINARSMVRFCGMNEEADKSGFVAVYPNGTGLANLFLTWNSGGFTGPKADKRPDDVKFIRAVLDDVATVINVDPKQVFAVGHSNGAMMCYRLAAEMPDRIAAIATVGGTLSVNVESLARPVSAIHFHGTNDKIVPYGGPDRFTPKFLTFKSAEDTVRTWAGLTGCPQEPSVEDVPDRCDDGTSVQRRTYGPGTDGAEVVLYRIEGGGHSWPGRDPTLPFVGKATKDICANQLIWDFFLRHPMN